MKLICCKNLNEAPEIHNKIKTLLINEDNAFVPPLSTRVNTTQSSFSEVSELHSIDNYFAAMIEQPIIISTDGDFLAGFMSYRTAHNCHEANADRCVYVSTVLVAPHYRGQHLACRFYQKLFSLVRETRMPIVTRTWSTNNSHIHVLHDLGFELVKCIVNDRGEGIDTVYYRKDLDPICTSKTW